MDVVLIVLVLLLLFGGGGYGYGHHYIGADVGGLLYTIILIVAVIWFIRWVSRRPGPPL